MTAREGGIGEPSRTGDVGEQRRARRADTEAEIAERARRRAASEHERAQHERERARLERERAEEHRRQALESPDDAALVAAVDRHEHAARMHDSAVAFHEDAARLHDEHVRQAEQIAAGSEATQLHQRDDRRG